MDRIEKQVNHLWRFHPNAPWDEQKMNSSTKSAYKDRRKDLKDRNKAILKATTHIEYHALIAFSKAATVLNICRKELLSGEFESALVYLERTQEFTDRLQDELDIVRKHLTYKKDKKNAVVSPNDE